METNAGTRAYRRSRRARNRVIILCILAVIIIGALFVLFGPLADKINADKPMQLKIGQSKFDYPPMHYYDNGELVGFDIDLANAAAELMNAEIEFVPIDWSASTDALESGEVDVLWGGLERASLDESKVKFTKSYLSANIVLLMPEDRNYAQFSDLQGLQVCALNFTPAFSYLKAYNRDVIKSKRSFTPPEYQELMDSLSSGEFDCMIADENFASFFLKANSGEVYNISNIILGASYAAAVRIDDTKLFDLLQAALDELQANGTIDKLKGKWIGD